MAKYSTGLKKIEMGAIAADGGMGTTLADVGEIYQGTASFEQDEPTETEHYSEQSDDPILTITKKGKTRIKFAIVDVTPTNLVLFMGGTAGGTTPAFTWGMPATFPAIEKSLKITTSQNYTLEIARCKIVGKITWPLGTNDMAKVEVTATVLTPSKTGTDPVKLTLA